MNITHIIIPALLLACPLPGMAQSTPAIAPSFTYTDSEGNEQTVTSADDQAPLAATFHANATDTEGWNAHYEWHFYLEGQRSNPYLVRYETDTQYTFTKAGTHLVELWATFVQGNDTIAYTDTYWQSEGTPLSISILEMPNAFSPNGDGLNDVYKAKSGYKSIVEFHATISPSSTAGDRNSTPGTTPQEDGTANSTARTWRRVSITCSSRPKGPTGGTIISSVT